MNHHMKKWEEDSKGVLNDLNKSLKRNHTFRACAHSIQLRQIQFQFQEINI